MFFSKDKKTKDSAPGALIIHLFGGIHEIYFPYVLMNPLLLLAAIGGSLEAMTYYTVFDLGLSGPASPGSVIAFLLMAPKGLYTCGTPWSSNSGSSFICNSNTNHQADRKQA